MRLERLSARDWRKAAPSRESSPRLRANSKRKFGTVGDAIIQVLAEAGSELRMTEIHAAVEVLLAGPVSRSSVKNYLKRGCVRRTPQFERVSRGRYQLPV